MLPECEEITSRQLVMDSSKELHMPILIPEGKPNPPKVGEVGIRMEWGGLNRIDQMLVTGQLKAPAGVHVLGGQGSGRIYALGEGVENLRIGELVALYPYGGCNDCRHCLDGNQTLCRLPRLDGVNSPGMFRSHVTALAADAFKVTEDVNSQLASLASSMAVAWHALVCRGAVKSGETIAICSITSGVGVCVGALAKLLGVRVVGVARTKTLSRLQKHLDWLLDTLVLEDLKQGSKVRVDIIIDAVGGSTLPLLHPLLRNGGRMVTIGAHVEAEYSLDLWRLFTKEQDIRGSHGCHRADMSRAIEILPQLDFSELVDSYFDLAEFEKAYKRLDEPGRLGKILLRLAPSALEV
jgi:D-arabinose 1-dehydrogenase-like Zn-dependent alcohol dehydrogenase